MTHAEYIAALEAAQSAKFALSAIGIGGGIAGVVAIVWIVAWWRITVTAIKNGYSQVMLPGYTSAIWVKTEKR